MLTTRLALVIVVDRLLTGFDSQYLSTLFADRPPMSPQEIIQSFSRTNRIFDQDKRYGNIITFQYPKTFSDKIDAALKLYTNGGIGEVMAPSWKESKQKFDQAYKDIQNYQAADGIPILEADDNDRNFSLSAIRRSIKPLELFKPITNSMILIQSKTLT